MVTWLRTFEGGPPLHEEELQSFEQKLGLRLPGSYRSFLVATNGGRPERDLLTISEFEGGQTVRLHLFFGLKDPVESCNLDWNLEVFQERLPPNLLPIATTEGADKICLSIAGERVGAVFYWDGYAQPGKRNLYFLFPDFASFMSALQSDELSPRTRAKV